MWPREYPVSGRNGQPIQTLAPNEAITDECECHKRTGHADGGVGTLMDYIRRLAGERRQRESSTGIQRGTDQDERCLNDQSSDRGIAKAEAE